MNDNLQTTLALLPTAAYFAQLVAELGDIGSSTCAGCAGLGHSVKQCAMTAEVELYLNVAVAQVEAHGGTGVPQDPPQLPQ